MTENSWNHVCELGKSKAISITLHMARGRQTSCYGKMKAEQSVLREVFERPACPFKTYYHWMARNDGNCRDHSGSKMACQNQTATRCRLQIMQKGTRTTRCEHWKVAGRDVWAHQQCSVLRWNGDNRHSCLPLHLETSVCQHASCTDTSE